MDVVDNTANAGISLSEAPVEAGLPWWILLLGGGAILAYLISRRK